MIANMIYQTKAVLGAILLLQVGLPSLKVEIASFLVSCDFPFYNKQIWAGPIIPQSHGYLFFSIS